MNQEGERVTVVTSDGVSFQMNVDVLKQSKTLSDLYETLGHCPTIHLPPDSVSPTVFEQVDKWFNDKPIIPHNICSLLALANASDYLDIPPLMEWCVDETVRLLQGRTPQEIRTDLHITTDFTKDEMQDLNAEIGQGPRPSKMKE